MTHFHIDADGRCAPARQLASPHHDMRPEGMRVELIVLHNISLPPGRFGGEEICDFFLGRLDPRGDAFLESIRHMRVSAHFLLRRDGAVVQFVPTGLRAWHAGLSQWRGRERCNDFSIGIEIEGTDDLPYDERQYAALGPLLQALAAAHPAVNGVAGHEHVAPVRKTDPGPAFDWVRVLKESGLPRAWFDAVPAERLG
ncbi:1,6-anhydro-N-acetylmuramyl-L-alanine amidase AmpD [Derxia gummosa]|uniref:1,6-anhydro-N-acetylmuramyl-L-alanine amidase AmpD n=1 Tax=Derxia gummosa DSM 723 TaxID=1121388 RepID=A0A8B6X6Q8_9BURK|nr:1,6-anhydro-N-acetylmuramyl-L-alanine amidase AmpD [Derxia gummosa]